MLVRLTVGDQNKLMIAQFALDEVVQRFFGPHEETLVFDPDQPLMSAQGALPSHSSTGERLGGVPWHLDTDVNEHMSDADLISIFQELFTEHLGLGVLFRHPAAALPDLVAVDECAVQAAQITDSHKRRIEQEDTMAAGDVGMGRSHRQADIALFRSANDAIAEVIEDIFLTPEITVEDSERNSRRHNELLTGEAPSYTKRVTHSSLKHNEPLPHGPNEREQKLCLFLEIFSQLGTHGKRRTARSPLVAPGAGRRVRSVGCRPIPGAHGRETLGCPVRRKAQNMQSQRNRWAIRYLQVAHQCAMVEVR
jgi:hypothetical protein